LFDFLSQAGHVLSAEVQRYEDTNRSKGWGLAQFNTHEEALQVVKMLDRKEFNGRHVHMRLDRANVDSNDDCVSVYVGNLTWSVTDLDLLSLFAPFSPISCHILTNMYGRSRGFAIVKFSDESSASRAIATWNQIEMAGRKIEVRNLLRGFL
jgi:RNA recognition motif-containing protein